MQQLPRVEMKTKVHRNFLLIVLAVASAFAFGYFFGNGKISVRRELPLASNSNTALPDNLDYSSVEIIYDLLKQDFDGELTQQELLDGIKQGLASATGDPYTEYFNPEEAKEFNEDLSGSFEGIGAELGKEEGSIVIVSPLSGFPADKAGLRPKDIIAKINSETVYDISISEAVKKIRGQKGTTVTLTIVRGTQPPFDVTITRETISIPSVESSIEEDIGYLKISRFGPDTVELARKAATEFKVRNVRGVVLDMRGNPGGLLDASVEISSIWLEKGKKVVQEKRGGKVLKTHYANGNQILSGVKTVVLINEGSASASEIVAGALKDNGVAELVGQKTYGKGSVQQIEPILSGGALKVTIARWYTPAGNSIDKTGITPKHKIEISDEQLQAKQDPQKDKAFELVRQ